MARGWEGYSVDFLYHSAAPVEGLGASNFFRSLGQ
jgi:hypothetical protein